MAVKKVSSEEPVTKRENKWVTVGWGLLLFAGMGHMLPEQMAPLLRWSLWGVSFQMAVGVVAVIIALNFLLED
jgi:hypothetical protein